MAQVAKLTIDSTKVPSNQTDFPVYVDLSDMGATFWSTAANGGGDIRVFKSDGTTELAREVVSCNKLTQDLVSYWKLDETSGNAADSVGSNTLTNNNSTAFATGKINNGADLVSASSNSFTLADSDTFSYTGTTNKTFSLWFKADSTTGVHTILSKWGGGTLTEYNLYTDGTTLTYFMLGTAAALTTTITTGTWYHVVITMDSSKHQQLYLNGSLISSRTSTDSVTGTTADFALGQNESSNYYDGMINEVGFWSRVLTPNEISVLYNSGKGIQASDGNNGTGELHFKYTGTLSSSTDTEVQIHADGVSSDYATNATYGAEAVWSDYSASYRMTNGNDSSSNGKDLTATGTISTITGKLGSGKSANWNTSNKYSQSALLSSALGTGNITFSTWFKKSSAPTNDYSPTIMKLGERIYLVANKTSGTISFSTYDDSPAYTNVVSTDGNVCDNDWHHIVGVRNGTTVAVYVDGVEYTNTGTIRNITTNEFLIGTINNYNYDNLLTASLNEIRVRTSVLSSDWITTEYNNQNSPSTFYTVTDAGITISVSDTLNLTESISTLRDRIVSVTNNVTLTESISAIKALTISVIDTLHLTETVSTLRSMVLSVVDTLGLSEVATLRKKIRNVSKNISTWASNAKNSSIWTNKPKA